MKYSRNSRLLTLILTNIIVVVIFLFPRTALSQNPEWMHFTFDNFGLKSNCIKALAVDTKGNIWVGIDWFGLAKFDGANWTLYNAINSDYPTCSSVRDFAIDAQGNIWMAAGGENGGLVKFDGTNWTVYNKDNSDLPSNYVQALAIDTQENIWVGTFNEGVVKFDGTNWTIYNEWNSEVPDGEAFTFVIDSQGNLWYATISPNGGLMEFDGSRWTVYSAFNYVRALAIDPKGNLWIGFLLPLPGGLAKFDGVNWTKYSGYSELPYGVLSLAVDSQDNIWVGSEGGLAKFDGSRWTTYNKYNSGLPSKAAEVLAVDFKDNIWIGTEDGLAVYREGGVILNNPVVVVEERYNKEPSVFTLLQNYPNPFNPSTEISFELPKNSQVTLTVFNTLGQKITTLVDETKVAGSYQVTWNGADSPTGIYFYCLKTEGFSKTMKMLLMK